MIGKKLAVGLVVLAFAAGQVDAAAVQWEVGSGGNGHWYEGVSNGVESISWFEARDAAETRGGHLATITSADENAFVYSVIDEASFWNSKQGPWLGATDAQQEGVWKWITGEAWAYSNWGEGEPNNLGNEDYLQFWANPWKEPLMAATWNDDVHDYPYVHSFVVEYNANPVPEPTSLVLWSGLGLMGLITVRRRKRTI